MARSLAEFASLVRTELDLAWRLFERLSLLGLAALCRLLTLVLEQILSKLYYKMSTVSLTKFGFLVPKFIEDVTEIVASQICT